MWDHTCILHSRSKGTQESLVERCGWGDGWVSMDTYHCTSWLQRYNSHVCLCVLHPCDAPSALTEAWSGCCWMDVASLLSSERKNVQITTGADARTLWLPATLCQAPIRQPCVQLWNNGPVGGYSKSQAFPSSTDTLFKSLLSWFPTKPHVSIVEDAQTDAFRPLSAETHIFTHNSE